MSRKRKSLLPFLALLGLFVSGALNRQVLFSTTPTPTPPPALPAQVSLSWQPCDRHPQQVIDAFINAIAPERSPWLRFSVRQRMELPDARFRSESRVYLGPDDCGRLELSVHNDQGATRVIVVCDGNTLARSVAGPGREAEVKTQKLPEPRDQRRVHLEEHGCSRPGQVLQRIRPHLRNLTTSQAQDKDVFRLRVAGQIDALHTGLPLPPAMPLKCCLYFDHDKAWLQRLEWWLPSAVGDRLVLEMDFVDFTVEALTDEECSRVFSFASK